MFSEDDEEPDLCCGSKAKEETEMALLVAALDRKEEGPTKEAGVKAWTELSPVACAKNAVNARDVDFIVSQLIN